MRIQTNAWYDIQPTLALAEGYGVVNGDAEDSSSDQGCQERDQDHVQIHIESCTYQGLTLLLAGVERGGPGRAESDDSDNA